MSNGSTLDPAMLRVREQFQRLSDRSEITLDELGQRMGYPKASARKSAWQFIYKTNDPRLSMLRKFAKAMGISVSRLTGPKD